MRLCLWAFSQQTMADDFQETTSSTLTMAAKTFLYMKHSQCLSYITFAINPETKGNLIQGLFTQSIMAKGRATKVLYLPSLDK